MMMTQVAVNNVIEVWKPFRSDALGQGSDLELLRRFVATRDEAAFDGLVRRHGPMVWGVCRRLLRHAQDAEDAFQTTFLVLARKAASVGRRELLANWLFGVARRSALTLRRSRARRAVHEFVCGEVPDVLHLTPEHWSDVAGVLDEEIARLPDKYRRPLLLCCLQGMTHASAAETLDWPIGTVAGRLSRARDLLRTRLRQRGVNVSGLALGAVLAPETYAVVPPVLVATSVRNGVVFAGTGVTATLSAPVAVTLQSLLRQMTLARAASTFVLVSLLTLALGGFGLWWHANKDVTAADSPPEPDPVTYARPPGIEFRRLNQRTVPLPQDPNAVVLALEVTDARPDRPASRVLVHADGRVISSSSKTLEGQPEPVTFEERLSAEDLQTLMQFVVLDQEFFHFQSVRLMQALRDRYEFDGLHKVPDSSRTTIRVRTADEDLEVQWDQLGTASIYFRDVRRIRQLVAIETRLKNLLFVQQAGGRPRVNQITALLNEELQRIWPREQPLCADDLAGLTPTADGRAVRFTYRRGYKYGGTEFFLVDYEVPPVGKPKISQLMPEASPNPPSLAKRPQVSPQCFEDDLDY